MLGICPYHLLEIMGKTEEIELINKKYSELDLKTNDLSYTFIYRGKGAKEKNSISSKIIEMLQNNQDIKKIFDDIFSDSSRINAELICVKKEDIAFFKNKIAEQLSPITVVKESRLKPTDFYGILYAVIGLKIYCERLKKNLILPEIRDTSGGICDESDAKKDFEKLSNNPKPSFYSLDGKVAAEIFNFKAKVACQFGDSPLLPILMQKLQLVGKIITYLSKEEPNKPPRCLDRAFTKEALFGTHVPNDFRPAAVKYIVNNRVEGIREKNGKLSMFNPTGGWGGRLIGALATPAISRYVETDPNPDLLAIKHKMVDAFGRGDKAVFVHQKPIELLEKEDYCPKTEDFAAGEGHDFSLFSPPYFNVEKYTDQIQKNYQSYNQYPVLEDWIRDFLLVLIDINYRALRVSGMMIINVAPIKVKNNLVHDVPNLKNIYPECIKEPENSKILVDIPKIIKIELNRGLRKRQWEYQTDLDLQYAAKDENNVVMFFKTKSPVTPLYRKFTHNFKVCPSEEKTNKRKLDIEESVTEEIGLKKRRL